MRAIRVILVLTILGFCLGQEESRCDLSCFLGNITLELGEHGFEVGKVESFVCRGLVLGDLESSFLAPSGVSLTVSDLQISCVANVKVDVFGTYVAQAYSQHSSLVASLVLVKDNSTGLVEKAVLEKNQASLSLHVDLPHHPWVQFFVRAVDRFYTPRLNRMIEQGLANGVDVQLTQLLKDINQRILPFLNNGGGPQVPIPDMPQAMNFSGSPLIGLVDFLLDDLIGANGPFGANLILSSITNATGRINVTFPADGLLLTTAPVGTLGNVSFGIMALSIDGLSSFSKLELLAPVDGVRLDSDFLLKELGFNVSFFVNTVVGEGSVSDSQTLYETGVLRCKLNDFGVDFSIDAGINARMANQLTFSQLTSVGCLRSALLGANVSQGVSTFDLRELVIKAVSQGTLERSLDKLIDNVLLLFVQSYSGVIPAFVNAIALPAAVDAGNNALRANLLDKPMQPCALAPVNAYSSAFPLNPVATVAVLGGATSIWLVICVMICAMHIVWYGADEDDDYDNESLLNVSSSDDLGPEVVQLILNDQVQSFQQRLVAAKKASPVDPPLGLHPKVHWIFRLGIPLLLIADIGLFICSNASVGASVFVYFHFSNHTISSDSLFSFTLANSVRDMWNAGVYPLSLIIAIFSGAWPYLKVLMMLFAWLIPIPVKPRERMLMALDALGKWSLIDTIILVFMMVAFRFNLIIPGSQLAHTQPGETTIDLTVQAGLGFHTFLIATMLSLLLTHIILAFHRLVYYDRRVISGAKKPLFQVAFRATDGQNVRVTWLGAVLVAGALALSFGLVIGGAFVDSFSFHFKGAAGALFPYAGVEKDRSFSLISLAMALPGVALNPNAVGTRWIQAVFLMFCCVIPLLYLVVLFVLWMVPMTPNVQSKVFVVAEICRAWSAMEVFVLGVVAAITELEQLAQFLVGGRCDFINPILEKFFSFLLDGDNKCFDVTTTLLPGCWLMFCACGLYIVVGQIVVVLCHNVLEANFVSHSEPNPADTSVTSTTKQSKFIRAYIWLRLLEKA